MKKTNDTLTTKACLRCGHRWYPRTPDQPRVCPACKSPYWDSPRKKPAKKNKKTA